ncbi:unnamed protein product [Cylicostephanus goldi]|uniref:Uncharacterized protein n=1 Tax=Cylicostephanus goldi TaxID=71465 RepID=A0A3P7N6W4_CYLGO|nr:unnamed protein product [Cylicostephanus goldi]
MAHLPGTKKLYAKDNEEPRVFETIFSEFVVRALVTANFTNHHNEAEPYTMCGGAGTEYGRYRLELQLLTEPHEIAQIAVSK